MGVQLGSRSLLVILAIAGLGLQAELWFSDDGYRKTLKLRTAVADQSALNDSLRDRNAALDAEVINLKQGSDAAEERARTDTRRGDVVARFTVRTAHPGCVERTHEGQDNVGYRPSPVDGRKGGSNHRFGCWSRCGIRNS